MEEIIHPEQSKYSNQIRNIILNLLLQGYGILLLRTYRMEYPLPHATSLSFVSSSVHWYFSLSPRPHTLPHNSPSFPSSPPSLITLSPYPNDTFLLDGTNPGTTSMEPSNPKFIQPP